MADNRARLDPDDHLRPSFRSYKALISIIQGPLLSSSEAVFPHHQKEAEEAERQRVMASNRARISPGAIIERIRHI